MLTSNYTATFDG